MINYRNVYHMLAYAFQVLNEKGYENIAKEEFENTAELLSAILCKGVSKQIKRGFMRDYIPQEERMASPRGKILISETIKTQAFRKHQLVCSYDDFTVNAYNNRVIRTTLDILMKSDISKSRKKEIRNLLVYFGNIEPINPYAINWKRNYNRNNQTYRMLISVCYLVMKGLLMTQEHGNMKLMQFFDDQRMSRLYEKFILEYYRRHFPEIKTTSSQIKWVVDDDYRVMLPVMQSDIMLEKDDKVLIIDAKYYGQNTQVQYADIQPDYSYMMSGNIISVTTLDLNREFDEIKTQLDRIADIHFGLT